MTVQTKKVKQQAPSEKNWKEIETEIKFLQSDAYEQIAQMENYQRLSQQCQQNIQKINEQIIKKKQEAARAGK